MTGHHLRHRLTELLQQAGQQGKAFAMRLWGAHTELMASRRTYRVAVQEGLSGIRQLIRISPLAAAVLAFAIAAHVAAFGDVHHGSHETTTWSGYEDESRHRW